MSFDIIGKFDGGVHLLFGGSVVFGAGPDAAFRHQFQRLIQDAHEQKLALGRIRVKGKQLGCNGFYLGSDLFIFWVVKKEIFTEPFFNKGKGYNHTDTRKMVCRVNISAGVRFSAVDKYPVGFAEIKVIRTGIKPYASSQGYRDLQAAVPVKGNIQISAR